MTDHDQITGRLAALAAGVDVRPDQAELFDRVRRHDRRRQRALAVALAVALVAGPAAGAALERNLRPETEAVAAGGDPDEPTTGQDEVATTPTGDEPAVDGDSEAGGQAFDDTAPGTSEAGDVSGRVDEGGGHWYGEPLDRIGTTTVGEVTVRLYGSDYGPPNDGNPFWDAPPGCYATGALSIQVSTPAFAAVLGMERYGHPDRVDGTVHLAGVAEGDPHWIVVAEVGDEPATVTFPDGQVGEGAGIAGFAVATAPAPGYAAVEQAHDGYQASLVAGGVTHPVRSWSGPSEEDDREQCQPPPPSLPEAGEQPGAPADATAAISAALTTVFEDPDDDDKAAAVQHPDVVLRGMVELAANYPGLVARPTLGEVVFTSPTTAAYYYDLDTDIVDYADQIGEALLVDGRWIITAETVCTQLRKGGATCEVPAG